MNVVICQWETKPNGDNGASTNYWQHCRNSMESWRSVCFYSGYSKIGHLKVTAIDSRKMKREEGMIGVLCTIHTDGSVLYWAKEHNSRLENLD